MYKFLSMLLAVLLLICGGFYLYERYKHNQDTALLNNQIAQQQQTIKETQDAYSKLAVEAKNLKVENAELQKKIKDRDEQIVSLTQVNIRLRDQIIQITNATQTEQNGRTKVEFSKDNGLLKVSGYTLTNPAFAQINLEWLRDINLQLVLVKDKNNIFRVYLDSQSSDIESATLSLKIDPSVFEYKWYERLAVSGGTLLGNNTLVSNVGIQLKIYNWLVGPSVGIVVGPSVQKVYGVQASWFPFERK